DSYEHLTRDNYPRRPDKIVVARPEKIVDVNHRVTLCWGAGLASLAA
ncbi:hypothetical protein P3T25_009637, partial [Paraburkholderia sp. GAS32]